MGVTYKLKPEIIEAITQRKRAFPKKSCRKITEEINSEFNVQISKSSVNTILKKFNLSSSVGRRSENENGMKKFEIPIKKKRLLKENVDKIGLNKSIDQNIEQVSDEHQQHSFRKESILDEPSSIEKGQRVNQTVSHASREPGDGIQGDLSKEDRGISSEQFNDRLKEILDKREAGWSKNYIGMGIVLVKAIRWEIGIDEKLISLLETVRGRQMSDDEKCAFNLWVDFQSAGIEPTDKKCDIKNHAVWAIHQITDQTRINELLKLVGALDNEINSLSVGLEKGFGILQELGAMFMAIKEIRIVLDNAHQIRFNGGFGSNTICFLYGAIKRVSRELIANANDVLISHKISSNNSLDDIMLFLSILDNQGQQRMRSLKIFDQYNHELASFKSIPKKKRSFVAGFSSENLYFRAMKRNARWASKEPVYVESLGIFLHVSELAIKEESDNCPVQLKGLRAIIVSDECSQGIETILLTNNLREASSRVVRRYYDRFPHDFFKKPEIAKANRDQDVFSPKEGFLMQFFMGAMDDAREIALNRILKAILDQICSISKKMLRQEDLSKNDVNYIDKSIYKISGKFQRGAGHALFQFQTTFDSPLNNLLQNAKTFLNEREIFDDQGDRTSILIK